MKSQRRLTRVSPETEKESTKTEKESRFYNLFKTFAAEEEPLSDRDYYGLTIS